MRFIILICITILTVSFQQGKYPPGTKAIKEKINVYLDKSEITNLDYRIYLYWLLQHDGKDSTAFTEALPDSKIWNTAYYNADLLHSFKYQDCPVVGVSYQQAINYCKWRTNIAIWRTISVSKERKKKLVYSLPDYSDYPVNTRPTKIYSPHYSRSSMKSKSFIGICANGKEMTSTFGIAIHNPLSNHPDTIHYSAPAPDLGFRCKATFATD